jgi:hypothetical protein
MRLLNFFSVLDSSSRTMALGFTQHLTNEYQNIVLGVKRGQHLRLTTAIFEPIV